MLNKTKCKNFKVIYQAKKPPHYKIEIEFLSILKLIRIYLSKA